MSGCPLSIRFAKRIAAVVLVILLSQAFLFADDWILASQKFSYTQKNTLTSSQEGMAALLPQLILEQVSSDAIRIPSAQEIAGRKSESLLQERQSLFLQLSKEVQVRDGMVIQQMDARKLKSQLDAQDKKIAALEASIQKNIEEQKLLELEIDEGLSAPSENVVLYKKDSSMLLEVPQEILVEDSFMTSRSFENFMNQNKINGLITGKMTVYGSYMMVTVELYSFPGAKLIGTVTEIAEVSDLQYLASAVAQSLMPKLANAMPVKLYFNILPQEIKQDVKLTVDGVVYSPAPQELILDSGAHRLSFECEGYSTQSVTYKFADASDFFVTVPMQVQTEGLYNIFYAVTPMDQVYLGNSLALEPGSNVCTVSINGNNVLGQITRKVWKNVPVQETDEEGNSLLTEKSKEQEIVGFYYIPEYMQLNEAWVTVNPKLVDRNELLDYRRRMAYTGYTSFVIALPLALISKGKFDSAFAAYNSGRLSDPGSVNFWYVARNVTGIAAGVSAGFFIYELVKYFQAADNVLPQKAKLIESKNQNESNGEEN